MKKTLLTIVVSFSFFLSARGQACVGSETLTASPPPNANGQYYPGTVVNFCYTVTNYLQTNADWMCGAVPTLGPGWDLSTLTPVSAPASCDGQGNWGWYPSCTSTATGITYGPGFYYDSPAGNVSGTLDGIPGNNFGDNCATYVWTFCFSVAIASNAPNGADVSVTMSAYSDNAVGSWGSPGCVDPPNAFNTQPATVVNCVLIVPTIVVTNASCGNSSDGSLTAIPAGIPPYTYLWSTGAVTSTISNLPPGIYTVTISDSTLCSKVTTINVGGPPPILPNATVVPNGCNPNGGSVTLATTGGTGSNYTYLWNNGAVTSGINNLAGGTYIVTITDSLNCTLVDTFTINTSVPITLTTSSTSTGCTGTNGTATVVASGGAPPFTYSWSPSGGNASMATNLAAGQYTVTVSDSAGCSTTAQVTVQAIGAFTLSTQFIPLACDPLGTTTATVQVSGGTAPFNYQWTPSGGNQQTGTGLTSGTYVVYVTDSNSCIDSAIVIIPAVVPVTASAVATPVACGVPSSGTASVTASGGTAPYTYSWSDGTLTSTAVNLTAGNYTVIVTDAQGCSGTTTVTVGVIPEVFADAGLNQTVCGGQPAILSGSASGGTAPFSYTWDNGSTGAIITVNPAVTTTYILTVSDANNCTATSTVTVTAIDYPVIVMSQDANICYGSSTIISAAGGTTYSWSPSGGLSDATVSAPLANPLATTTYYVTVANGPCASNDSVTVTVEPDINASFSPDTSSGQAPLSVNFTGNTTGASTYNWYFGDGTTASGQSPTHIYSQQGSYTVIMVATNSLGCTDTARYSFIVVDELASLTVPNVFTPNNDGKNDTFEFIEVGISAISVKIFNRWGKDVYSWSVTNGSWDGRSKDGEVLPDGVYLYIISAKGIDDKSYDSQGTVHLIRNVK